MRSPQRRARLQPVLLFFAVLPFWSNYLIRTYAWIVLLNREGLITQLLRWFGYAGEPPSMLYTEGAVIAGLVYNYLPFVILACYAPLSRLNPELTEASRDLGASALHHVPAGDAAADAARHRRRRGVRLRAVDRQFRDAGAARRRPLPDDRQPRLRPVPDRQRLAVRRGAVDGADRHHDAAAHLAGAWPPSGPPARTAEARGGGDG